MTRRNSEEPGIGEDAFMDTIANLVGIMIILVVIVGARGYTSAKSLAKETQQEKIDDLKAPLEVAKISNGISKAFPTNSENTTSKSLTATLNA